MREVQSEWQCRLMMMIVPGSSSSSGLVLVLVLVLVSITITITITITVGRRARGDFAAQSAQHYYCYIAAAATATAAVAAATILLLLLLLLLLLVVLLLLLLHRNHKPQYGKRFFTSGNSCFVGLPKLISPCYKNESWKLRPYTKSRKETFDLKTKRRMKQPTKRWNIHSGTFPA